jgi:hypothetical protein
MPKLGYIGGYGHSGSTLLEYLMTGCPSIVAFGEVVNSLNLPGDRQCTCGRSAKDCWFWGYFLRVRSSNSTAFSHAALIDVLLGKIADHYGAAIDSSKTAWGRGFMPFKLRRRLGEDFLLIHLVRDPRGVCWSNIQRAGRKIKYGPQLNKTLECCSTVLGWWVANLSCEAFNLIYPAQYIRIRYEDFSNFPQEVLDVLFDKLLPIGYFAKVKGGASHNRHQLYGNRIRRRRLSLLDVKEDTSWKSEMPSIYRWLVLIISFPLRQKYNYY